MRTIDRVLKFLNEVPETRDNDELLTAGMWYEEGAGGSTVDFLKAYSERKFTSAESIRRCRQKLQEEYPGLRGRTYTIRKKTNHKQLFT